MSCRKASTIAYKFIPSTFTLAVHVFFPLVAEVSFRILGVSTFISRLSIAIAPHFLSGADLGLGFASAELIAKPALTASWHANLAKVSERLQFESTAGLIAASPWVAKVAEDCNLSFREAAGHGATLGDPNVKLSQHDAAQAAIANRHGVVH